MEDPHPTRRYSDQKVWVLSFFFCLTIGAVFEDCRHRGLPGHLRERQLASSCPAQGAPCSDLHYACGCARIGFCVRHPLLCGHGLTLWAGGIQEASHKFGRNMLFGTEDMSVGCVIAQALFTHRVSVTSLKSSLAQWNLALLNVT